MYSFYFSFPSLGFIWFLALLTQNRQTGCLSSSSKTYHGVSELTSDRVRGVQTTFSVHSQVSSITESLHCLELVFIFMLPLLQVSMQVFCAYLRTTAAYFSMSNTMLLLPTKWDLCKLQFPVFKILEFYCLLCHLQFFFSLIFLRSGLVAIIQSPSNTAKTVFLEASFMWYIFCLFYWKSQQSLFLFLWL